MANKIYDSPGVYMTEKDLTFSTEVVGITTLGLVGETMKGPAMQPIFIKNYDDFKVMFGSTSPEKYRKTQIPKYELAYIAKAYLSQTNQLYVTRVLGLSGYDGKKAFALRTIGAVDSTTLDSSGSTITIPFKIVNNEFQTVSGSTPLLDAIAAATNVDSVDFNDAFNTFFTTGSTSPWRNAAPNANGLSWGTLTTALQATFTGELTGGTEYFAYKLPSELLPSIQEKRNQNWLMTKFVLAGTGYTGNAFALFIVPNTITATGGTVTIHTLAYSAVPKAEYHNKLIATLRSRGTYVGGNFYPNVTNSISLTNTEDVNGDPFVNFHITGATTTPTGTTFDYVVNFDTNSSSYIKNVLGSTPTDKDVYLYAEECYPTVLAYGYNRQYIKGISSTAVVATNWDHFLTKFQSPVTPYFVSELRGGVPQKLFRLISISDGNTANVEIKISIANVDLANKTFNLYVRAFNDIDRTPAFLERFLNCNMNPASDDFIGRKIGTSDNMFDLKSAYVMVELNEYAPIDAVPAGFEGYTFRTFTDVEVPKIAYKTKYYAPGEVMYTPPYSTAVTSAGDKVKKVYLGFSDTIGIDADLLQFKGWYYSGSKTYDTGTEWAGITRGFHLDMNATGVTDNQGNQLFESGAGQFTDAVDLATDISEPYYDIRARKYTTCFYGGFDGWDIYRDYRTNEDDYKIGRTKFVAGESAGIFDQFNIEGRDDMYGSSDYYAYLIGAETMENPESVNINILATPGIDILGNTDLIRDVIDIIEEKRQDSVYLPTLPDILLRNNLYPSDTSNWYYPRDIVGELESTEIESNYCAVYYPWYQVFDGENNTNLFIPPTTDVVRNLALTDNIAHPWYATAGSKRGLVNAKRTRINLTQDMRDDLYNGRINPLATFSDIGVAIWGNKNLQVANSAMNRLNIRRLLIQCKKLIGAAGNRLLFDPNDDTIKNDFLALVNPILDSIRKERGLIDFRVKLLPLTDGVDRNTLRGKIFLKPTPALEVIELEFTVTPTNVSFDNF